MCPFSITKVPSYHYHFLVPALFCSLPFWFFVFVWVCVCVFSVCVCVCVCVSPGQCGLSAGHFTLAFDSCKRVMWAWRHGEDSQMLPTAASPSRKTDLRRVSFHPNIYYIYKSYIYLSINYGKIYKSVRLNGSTSSHNHVQNCQASSSSLQPSGCGAVLRQRCINPTLYMC